MSSLTSKSGSCLCGAINYTAQTDGNYGACHCSMCRKFSGGVFLAFAAKNVKFDGAENIATHQSSDWAERAHCKTCGTSLYYKLTLDIPAAQEYHIGAGTLDDLSDMTFDSQIFIDEKPHGYSFAEKTKDMTGAEVFAAAGASEEG